MIARLQGTIAEILRGELLLQVGQVTYSVMIAPYLERNLAENNLQGTETVFHTYHYLEGSVTMGNLIPRLVGFSGKSDIDFFIYICLGCTCIYISSTIFEEKIFYIP